jgi:hypothetical protein
MTTSRAAILAVSVLMVSSCSKLQGLAGGTSESESQSTPHPVGGGGPGPSRSTVRPPPLITEKCDATMRSFSMCGNEETRATHFTASTWFRDRPDFGMPRSRKSR